MAATALAVALPATGAAAASGKTYFAQGSSSTGAAYKPNDLYLTGDSTQIIKVKDYWKWTTTRASGHGTYVLDKCNPHCTTGPFKRYPVRFVLKDPQKFCHKEFFTRINVTYTGKRPQDASKEFHQNVSPAGCG